MKAVGQALRLGFAVGLAVGVGAAPLNASATAAHHGDAVGSLHSEAVGARALSTAATPLTVDVVGLQPWTPASSTSQRAFTISVELTNTTIQAIRDVTLTVGRDQPVTTETGLAASLATRTAPAGLLTIPAHPAAKTTITVPAGKTVTATFRTTTGINSPQRLCLCANAVYPLYVSAIDSSTNAVEGFARTYVPSVYRAPDSSGDPFEKLQVAWVWPLIDRPHRLVDSNVFTDDDLATELEPGGRLDRALQVVEGVDGDVPLTVMIDPELVDEVSVLASGDWSYVTSDDKTVRGDSTASSAAAAWLTRLQAVVADPSVAVQFTPYADPAIQSLAVNGLEWQSTLPTAMRSQVLSALGRPSTFDTSLSWPPGELATAATLDAIASHGSRGVLLNSADMSPSTVDGLPSSLATVHTPSGTLTAGLVSSTTQALVAQAVTYPTGRLSQLPELLAELAVRADTQPYRQRVAFLTPPRYVNPSPEAAEAVIRATSVSAFSTPVSASAVLSDPGALTASKSVVRDVSASSGGLAPALVAGASQIAAAVPAVRSLLTGASASPAGLALVDSLPAALQRVESAGWDSDSSIASRAGGAAAVSGLLRQVTGLLSGVHIVRPKSGSYSYTLASRNSPLPITVENTLPYRAFVRIDVGTAGGLPGLSTTELGVQTIGPDSRETFRVPAHVQRSGQIQLIATLHTPRFGEVLGPRVVLSVHSTVFGAIGVVITIAAGGVLLFALALRYVRRIRRLGRRRRGAAIAGQARSRVSLT